MKRRLALPAAAIAAVVLLSGCNAADETSSRLGFTGSDSAANAVPTPVHLPDRPAGEVGLMGAGDDLIRHEVQRYRDAGHSVDTAFGGAEAGFAALCAGSTDVVDSSTPISSAQLKACTANGLDVVQFALAADAVVVAIRNETDIGGDCMSTTQVKDVFRAGSPYTNWKQVGFADVPLTAGGPAATADDFKVFATQVLGSLRPGPADVRFDYAAHGDDDGARTWMTGSPDWQQRADQAGGLQGALAKLRSQLADQQQTYDAARQDLTYATAALQADQQVGATSAQLASDQKAVFDAEGRMQGAQQWIPTYQAQVAAAKQAYDAAHHAQVQLDDLRGRIGIYGFPYYQVYEEQLRPMEITLPSGKRDCIFPNEQTIMNGQYPLARRMLLTTTTRSLARSEVDDLLTSVLGRVRADAAAAGLVAVDRATLAQQLEWVQNSRDATVLVGPKPTTAPAAEVPAQ